MKLNLIILESKKSFGRHEIKQLRTVINKHGRKAGKLLGIPLVNVTVYPTKDVIPETGEAGYVKEGSDWIQISIDSTRKPKELQKIISVIIPATIYHEMYHIGREKYVGLSKNLLEAVISEGLADTFAKEQWPKFKAPWSKYSTKKLQPFLKVLRKERKNKKYSHSDWFLGTGKMPRWLGYKLGSYIIESVKVRNSDLTALKMMKMQTNKIVKLSGISI